MDEVDEFPRVVFSSQEQFFRESQPLMITSNLESKTCPTARTRSKKVTIHTVSGHCCSPKVALCGVIISVFGIITLFVLAIGFRSRWLMFAKDFEVDHTETKMHDEHIIKHYNVKYDQAAKNCWVALFLYVVTLIISLMQYKLGTTIEYGNPAIESVGAKGRQESTHYVTTTTRHKSRQHSSKSSGRLSR